MGWKKRVIDLVLSRLDPSGTVLLDWLGSRVDDSMLSEIAHADYGWGAEKNWPVLWLIREQQKLPAPLPWHPREVLELTRWLEPDDPSSNPTSTGTRGHLIRAFSCAILVKAAYDPLNLAYIDDENQTLAQMIASVLYLGREATENASRLLSWRIARLRGFNTDAPFFALGLLLLRAALFEPGKELSAVHGSDLKLLADFVLREEARLRRYYTIWHTTFSEEWLLGLTYFDQRHSVWKRLAQQVLLDQTNDYPEPAASAMRRIAEKLA